ncbi:MAG: PaaI family thioesterase [Deltaproteobacteria bacterium]|nr:MAG: PaaI family thioesterase [Deltaproteobacteria bacterium]TMQ24209.1 MAG: PaaI family thioesterase [Deltaproteobacteria bacterium]
MTAAEPDPPAPTLIERMTAAKASHDYQGLIDLVPYARFLGLTAAMQGDELITTMRYSGHLIGNPALPALHGGTLGALLESAAIFELVWRAETVVLPKTITLTVDYLRSGAPVDTHARGVVTRQGRRVTNVRMEAWQADRAAPVATAHAVFLVMRG